MVTQASVEEQLKAIGFNFHGWGRTEIRELPHIILPDEEIYECVNGFYEAGFALLVATNFRVLLVDKKPLNYLTVEDLRFDMISEIDFNHRLLVAQIGISTGTKNLKFNSLNKARLRKLIGHVQHCMADNKKKQSEHEEDQKLHLEQINQQLQAYLLAQHQERQKLQQQLQQAGTRDATGQNGSVPDQLRPNPELADYLYAQGLLAKHQEAFSRSASGQGREPAVAQAPQAPLTKEAQPGASAETRLADLYAEGMEEVFGKRPPPPSAPDRAAAQIPAEPETSHDESPHHALEVNPLRVAYSKLPMAMRNRKFGRPSFHAHSQQPEILETLPSQPEAVSLR